MPNEDKKPAFKFVAIAASAVLVAALAATGILAYGQNNTDNMTSLDANATGTASANTTSTSNATEDTGEETFTASAEPNSQCSSVYTTEGAVSLNSTTTMTAEALSEEAETMTAGLNDTQVASLDQLIENACDAIREGKSVTALGHLQAARDILSGAETTETAGDEFEVEDEDEAGDIDAEDEEDVDAEIEDNSTDNFTGQ
jgi:hypothetical protein